MPSPEQVRRQVNELVAFLVEVGLAGDQNYAFRREAATGLVEITFPQAEHTSLALRNRSYVEVYDHLMRERAYNARMPDGALVQLMYLFDGDRLRRHRLAFFPAPHLEEFQNNPDIYLEDSLYADVVARGIVPFPVRFDFDSEDRDHQLAHPKSHLTLGQYKNCRIPVTAPLTPVRFIDFILRNFYHTAFAQFADSIPVSDHYFEDSILPTERLVAHLAVPASPKQRS